MDKIIELVGGTARAHYDEVKTTILNVAGELSFSLYLAQRPTEPQKRVRLRPIQTKLAQLTALFEKLDPDTARMLKQIAGRDPHDPWTEPRRVDGQALYRSALNRLKFDGVGRERSHDPDVAATLEAAVREASTSSPTNQNDAGLHGATRYRRAIEGLALLRAWTDTALKELPEGKKGRRRLDPARETAKALLDMKRHYNKTRRSPVTERGLLDLLTAVALPVFARYDQTPKLEAIVKEVLPTYKPSKNASSD